MERDGRPSNDAEEIEAASSTKIIKRFRTTLVNDPQIHGGRTGKLHVSAAASSCLFQGISLLVRHPDGYSDLSQGLKLNNLLALVPATISAYHCKLWGEYPGPVDGEPDEPVHGMAYEIQSPEENKLLQAYETDRYFMTRCSIEFEDEDGTEVAGNTFKWCGDNTELKEGEFNLKDWTMDMPERELEGSRNHWSQGQ